MESGAYGIVGVPVKKVVSMSAVHVGFVGMLGGADVGGDATSVSGAATRRSSGTPNEESPTNHDTSTPTEAEPQEGDNKDSVSVAVFCIDLSTPS